MFKKALFLIAMFCAAVATATAQTQEQESDLKAAFIYNFTRYVEWNINLNEDEFVIGIIGNSLIDAPIAAIAKTNMVNNKKIVIKHFSKPEDITYCHILFIPRNTVFGVQSILDKAPKGVLTIGDSPGFAKNGTGFNFVLTNEKLKFEVNLTAINTAGLKVSSQLLKLATIVN